MPVTIKGPWSQQQITEFFEEVRVPLRVACNGLSGTPVLASLWYLPEEGRLWCATQSQSSAARLLAGATYRVPAGLSPGAAAAGLPTGLPAVA